MTVDPVFAAVLHTPELQAKIAADPHYVPRYIIKDPMTNQRYQADDPTVGELITDLRPEEG